MVPAVSLDRALSKESYNPILSEAALHRWKKEAKTKGIAIPNGKTTPERWSKQDKFSIVVETVKISEIELGIRP